jgi:hypothetical protein
MAKKELNTSKILNVFWDAPPPALFDQNVISIVLQRSTASLERDRFIGAGLPFKKVGRLVRYVKLDVLDWLQKNAPTIISTTEYSERHKNDSI